MWGAMLKLITVGVRQVNIPENTYTQVEVVGVYTGRS
jgi:hypothetical protein